LHLHGLACTLHGSENDRGDEPELITPPAHYRAADRPRALAHPAAILAVAVVIGIILDNIYPTEPLPRTLSWFLAAICGALAIGIGTAATQLLRRTDSALLPSGLVTVFVVAGPYRYSRNPIIIAQALLLTCLGLAMNSAPLLIMLLPWALIVHFTFIKPEECYLERKFGDTYLAYKHRVRRWL
jgi:protein-S-isoprenylcysteine O-methyltransferase Ste14